MTNHDQFHSQELVTNPSKIESGERNLPISFRVADDGTFFFNATSQEDGKGVGIGGRISGEKVKLNFTRADSILRGEGLSSKLLALMEDELGKIGIKTIYATFARVDQVGFYLANGYRIMPVESMPEQERTELAIDTEAFDIGIKNDDDFDGIKDQTGRRLGQILLVKEIGKR